MFYSQGFQQMYWQTLPNLANDLFDIVAHLDLVKLTGIKTEALYEKEINNALNAFKLNNQIVEINTKHSKIENEPSDTILEKIVEIKIPVVFSSDAHIKNQIVYRFEEEQQRLSGMLSKMRYISKTTELLDFLKFRNSIHNR